MTEYTYDETKRLERITDPWGNYAEYFLYGQEEEGGPFGALKQINYSNGTKTEYAYDSQNRLDVLTNFASDESEMSLFDYNYDLNGNVERIALVDDDVWAYEYDPLNRLTMEKRLDGSNQERWHREYDFDPVGNRSWLGWWNGSEYIETGYDYNTLNQLTYREDDSVYDYEYDDNGNLEQITKDTTNVTLNDWTIDDRLASVDNANGLTGYAYDYKGARIMRTQDQDSSVTRYFFNGITEEVVKEAVPGAESADAFSFTQKENGESAGEWDRCGGPAGWSIASASDETHRSNVIRCQGASGNMFVIGDDNNTNYNTNGTPWNSTERALSFWYRGNWVQMSVMLSTNVGERVLYYHAASGTNYCDENDHVHIYLSASAESNSWQRFDRNIAADYEAYETETWSNTDGVIIEFGSGDTDFLIDDIRLSNSMTKEFNALKVGMMAQIIAQYTFANGAPHKTIAWLSYDRLGNVRGNSDTGGDSLTYADMDAYGNVLSSMATGDWADTFSGRHLTTKEYDPDAEMYYFWQRYLEPSTGRFASRSPFRPDKEHQYVIAQNATISLVDPAGRIGVNANLAFYGNWCGGGWSGGWAKKEHNGQMGMAPSCDKMDNCCMLHDLCYAAGFPEAFCDAALCSCVGLLSETDIITGINDCCKVNGSNGNNPNAFDYFKLINNTFCHGKLPDPRR